MDHPRGATVQPPEAGGITRFERTRTRLLVAGRRGMKWLSSESDDAARSGRTDTRKMGTPPHAATEIARCAGPAAAPAGRWFAPAAARALAERTHRGLVDRYGLSVIEHVRRVAAAVPSRAQTVAWLHEALELAALTRDELRAAGVTRDEISAIELLTRDRDGDEAAYLDHVARIARATGNPGKLARSVKRADLADRALHAVSGPEIPVHPPYLEALSLLAASTASSASGRMRAAGRQLGVTAPRRTTAGTARSRPAPSGARIRPRPAPSA